MSVPQKTVDRHNMRTMPDLELTSSLIIPRHLVGFREMGRLVGTSPSINALILKEWRLSRGLTPTLEL